MAQGIGGYLMDAAQTFGDNLIGMFDRVGELAMGAIGMPSGSDVVNKPMPGLAAALDTGTGLGLDMGAGFAQSASQGIMLSGNAMSPLQAEKDNSINMEWSNADRGMVLGNLPRPITPAVDMPQRGAGLAL